jgi:hypothetical protein
MAFPDTPNRLEAVFVQRDTTNSRYEQINISASNAIVYLDKMEKSKLIKSTFGLQNTALRPTLVVPQPLRGHPVLFLRTQLHSLRCLCLLVQHHGHQVRLAHRIHFFCIIFGDFLYVY